MIYINLFFIYSFLGYIFESIINKNYDSGILIGPITPIYGIAFIIIIIVHKYLISKIKNKFLEILTTFITITILFTIFEFIAGNLIEFFTNKIYWNYNLLKSNFGNYIAAEISFTWGILGTIIIYLINPFIEKIAKNLPIYNTIIFIGLLIIDIITILVCH